MVAELVHPWHRTRPVEGFVVRSSGAGGFAVTSPIGVGREGPDGCAEAFDGVDDGFESNRMEQVEDVLCAGQLGVDDRVRRMATSQCARDPSSPQASARRNRLTANNQSTERIATSSNARSHGAGRTQPTTRAAAAPPASATLTGR
jgi:hypothetical protein